MVPARDAERRLLDGHRRSGGHCTAPVLVASVEHTAALDEALGDRYVSEFYGLRPEVPLALYIERGLWERFLATVTRVDPGP